ncbi:hypothetical protein ES703_117539 [subsurface metagenome]
MAIVLQDGVLTDITHTRVRDWIHEQAELVAVVSLPEHTFTPYGASPKTSLVFLKKYTDRNKIVRDKPVFFAKVDDIGYECSGMAKGQSEIRDVVEAFHKYRGW